VKQALLRTPPAPQTAEEYARQVQESQCTKDAQTLAKAYIQGGPEEYQARHDELLRGRKIKDFEHAILIERIKTILTSNGIIIKRRPSHVS
jgi:hypothetical protein